MSSWLFLFLLFALFLSVCPCVCGGVPWVEIRGQCLEVSSLFPLCGSRESDYLDHHARWQTIFPALPFSLALDISLLELLFKSFLLDYMVVCYKSLLQVLEDMPINFYLVTRPATAPQGSSGCYLLRLTLFLWGLLAFGKLALKTQKKRQLLPPWLVILKEKKQEAIYRFFEPELCDTQTLNWLVSFYR